MSARRRALVAGLVASAVALPGPLGITSGAAAAPSPTAKASPDAVKPGRVVTVEGKLPGCGGQPLQISQVYTDQVGNRTETQPPMPGMAMPDGSFSAQLTVPAKATRSDIFRPYGYWQYDNVVIEAPGCSGGTVVAANVEVLPIRTDQHITVSSKKPRSGSKLRVKATNCVGGVMPEFTWVIDGAGSYFMTKGEQTGNTFEGVADLAKGYKGDSHPTGAATPSKPKGAKDTSVAVPCAQSEGPPSVAKQDKLFHVTSVIDITIRKAKKS